MNQEVIEKLAAILREIVSQIDAMDNGLPKNWETMMMIQLNDLEEINNKKK